MEAMPWRRAHPAILLANPDDDAVRAEVPPCSTAWPRIPANGIDRILLTMKSFVMAFSRCGLSSCHSRMLEGGCHFWILCVLPSNSAAPGNVSSDRPELRSSFFIVAACCGRRSLGEIDMRRIAPTLAGIMGLAARPDKPAVARVA